MNAPADSFDQFLMEFLSLLQIPAKRTVFCLRICDHTHMCPEIGRMFFRSIASILMESKV